MKTACNTDIHIFPRLAADDCSYFNNFVAVVSDSEEEESFDEQCSLSLPPEVWAMALDYLPYQSILSCAATSRSMLNDVLPLVSTLYIDKSSQLQRGMVSKQLRDVRNVHIFSLFNKTSDDLDGIGLDHDTATMAVPFLSSLPQLESVSFGGKKLDRLCRLGALERVSGRLPVSSDEEESLNHLIEAFSGHFICRALPKRLKVVGLRCPEYHGTYSAREECRICQRACKRFPIEHAMDMDLCLSVNTCKSIVESRPGGKEYLLSGGRFLQLLGRGLKLNPRTDVCIIDYGKEARDEMESFIQQSNFDVIRLDPKDVSNAITQCFEKDDFLDRTTCCLSEESFDYLKADLKLPIKVELLDHRANRLENLFRMVNGVIEDNSPLHHTKQIRRLLGLANPPTQQMIESGVLPKIAQFLHRDDDSELQLEATWILTNVASGESQHVEAVVELGVIPQLINLLGSPDEVAVYAAWALGNIAGDGPEYRDLVLQSGAMQPMCQHLSQKNEDLDSVQTATWALRNFCSGHPKPDFNLMRYSLPVLSDLISNTDMEVAKDACWALSHLSNGPDLHTQEVIKALDEEGGRRLINLLLNPSNEVQASALRAVGNILRGATSQVQFLVNHGVLPCLLALLSSRKKEIVKEALWGISNIAAGNKDQIQAVIDNKIIPTLIRLLHSEQEDVRHEAAWAVANIVCGGRAKQVKLLVHHGCIPPLCNLLADDDDERVSFVLEVLKRILKVGASEAIAEGCQNQMSICVIEAEGLTNIEALQDHHDDDIQNKSINILESYFCDGRFTS